MGIKENEEAAKQAMPGMTTTRPPYTNYYLTIREWEKYSWNKIVDGEDLGDSNIIIFSKISKIRKIDNHLKRCLMAK